MKESLISHQRTVHENEKAFKCEICHKRFGGKSDFNRHQRNVDENEKPFEFEMCQKNLEIILI